MPTRFQLLLFPLLLAACDRPQGEVVTADDFLDSAEMALVPSPDSEGAGWTVEASGLAIGFGKDPAAPYLSLACELSDEHAARLTIVRHARSEPGAKALFAVLGNGIAARMKVDAVLSDEGWRWEGTLPADSGEFDVFTGPRAVEATLPGAGTIRFPPSNLPREFIEWCRRDGEPLNPPEPDSPGSKE